MSTTISIKEFLLNEKNFPIIDSRSPIEFQQGNIPTSINIPLFTDEERSKVGILYKQKGKEQATLLGIQFATENLEKLISELQNISTGKNKICIYCWRGGMRSKALSWIASKTKIETYRIEGGYKSFRRNIRNTFQKNFNLIVIGGYTGSGKTSLLHEIKKMGEQIIDIEEIAQHRGSAFGGIGTKGFPTQEQFENILGWELLKLDCTKPIFIEDESRLTGRLVLPEDLWNQIRSSHVIFLDLPRELRLENLVNEYGKHSEEELSTSFIKLKKKIGGEKTTLALNYLTQKNYYAAADIALTYYDKLYNKGLLFRKKELISNLNLATSNVELNAEKILNFIPNYVESN